MEGIVYLNPQGEVEIVNEAVERLHGHTLEELTDPDADPRGRIVRADGTPMPVEDQPAIVALRTGEAVRDVEMGVPLSDGSLRWRLVNAQPVRDDQGKLLGAVASFFDITERKSAEAERERLLAQVQDERERLRAAAAAAHFGTFSVDIVNERAYWSPEYRAIVGMTPDEPPDPPRAVPHYIHPDDVEIASEMVRKAVDPAGDGVIAVEHRIVRPDGAVRWVQLQGQVTFASEGTTRHPVSADGFMIDITDRKQAEEALRLSEQEAQDTRAILQAALASMSDAVFISDRDGNLVEYNDAFVSYHRFASREDCSRHISDCVTTLQAHFADGNEAPPQQWALPRALRGESVGYTEYFLRKRTTGETWWGGYSFAPIRDANGEIAGAVVVARDITERKRAEADREQLLAQVGAERERLFSVLSTFPAYVVLLTPEYE